MDARPVAGIDANLAPDADRSHGRALLILLVVTTLARLFAAGMLDLGQDEAYALAVSRPFQWSFFDHPPLAFWTAGLMQAIFGRELPPLLLRLPFVLMFTGSTWAMFALTRRFYGARAGLLAAALLNTAPFFFASAGSWVVPDGPLVLGLLLAGLFLARALANPAQGGWRDWLLTGLFLGLALLSKYQAVLTLIGAFAFMLSSRSGRTWLRRPQPFVAAAVAVLLFSPAIGWNAAHDWVSFRFQLGRGGGGADSAIHPLQVLVLLGGEAAYLLPWLIAALVCAVFASRRRAGAGFFVALALPPILLFNLLPLSGSLGLPHWSMAGWMFLFPLLGAWFAEAQAVGRRWPAIFTGVSAAAMAAILVAAILLFSDHRVYSGNSDLNHALIESSDWSGVREGLAAKGMLDRPNTFLASTSWLNGAHLAEALRPADPPVVFGNDPRGFAFISHPGDHLGEDAIFADTPEAITVIQRFAAAHFDSVETVGTFVTMKGGAPAYTQTVLLAHNFRTPVATPYGN